MKQYHTPSQLVTLLLSRLKRDKRPVPSRAGLVHLFETLLFASMKTEEAHLSRCRIAFVNPEQPDPERPKRIRPQRWSVISFQHRLPMTIENLAKLSHGVPYYSAEIAVYLDKEHKPFIWGIIDQVSSYLAFMNREIDEVFDRAGEFQVEILSAGEIVLYRNLDIIAALRRGCIVSKHLNVLVNGPLADKLFDYINPIPTQAGRRAVERCSRFGEISDFSKHEIDKLIHNANMDAITAWLNILTRILLGIKRQRHGGALLFAKQINNRNLNIKHVIRYEKMQKLIPTYAAAKAADLLFFNRHIDQQEDTIAASTHYGEAIAQVDKTEAAQAITGAIDLTVGLSRNDGLVLMKNGLSLAGFGVEIKTPGELSEVYIARDENASMDNLIQVDPVHFGTRHRSMFRFCKMNRSAIGFVVSQDGDIRAITNLSGKVVIWENIRLWGNIVPARFRKN